MKAVLVIDMPRTCYECRIYQDGLDGYCPVGYLSPSDKYNKREDRCPLKPLPERWEGELQNSHPLSVYSQGMRDGFNMCLEEITE